MVRRDKDGHLLKDVQPFPLFSFEAERLSEAVIKGDLDLAESIIVESTTISINERDTHGFTVLFRAIQYSHFDIALMLLELGADPKQKNADIIGQTIQVRCVQSDELCAMNVVQWKKLVMNNSC
ncbi:hypothetical protein AKO1_004711 [Acrasis kona]|uniref:Uncharacterized protein n=1 Tax=Acrasis kona TaxID=1008807 RepID=A0AAW2Z2N7_9EUKA